MACKDNVFENLGNFMEMALWGLLIGSAGYTVIAVGGKIRGNKGKNRGAGGKKPTPKKPARAEITKALLRPAKGKS